MSTLQTLTDAFTELERRADAVSRAAGDPRTDPPARSRVRTPLVAASVAATLAVAGGAALLARDGSDHGTRQPAGASGTTGPAASAPLARSTPVFRIPDTAADLEARFRTVLGDLATFTVTDTGSAVIMSAPPTRVTVKGPNGQAHLMPAVASSGAQSGAGIVGVLTSGGVSGGYDIQIFQNDVGAKAVCDDGDSSRCTVTGTADGGSLAVGREPLPTGGTGGVTYEVDLVRGDGVEFLMHVSNERDPKGESPTLAPQPPLTTEQMVSIVTSDRW